MANPTNIKNIKVSFAGTQELNAWVANLATDIGAGKVIGFNLSTDKIEGAIMGTLTIPTPTDLTVALEDPPE